MLKCCDNDEIHPLEKITAGLPVIPRQLNGFPEVRQRLLERLADTNNLNRQRALSEWRPYSDDFGSMTLEMWAYTADILGFYDERVSNETYLGTAQRRASLRRLVGLLGHTPTSGIAATATIAALADGNVPVIVPIATGVRSRGFDGHAPQVFETNEETTIYPQLNTWSVEPFRREPKVDASFFVTELGLPDNSVNSEQDSGENLVNRPLFLTQNFGLAESELCLIEAKPGKQFQEQGTRVRTIEGFGGIDGKSYNRVRIDPPIVIDPAIDLSTLRARRPTQQMVATVNAPISSTKSSTDVLANKRRRSDARAESTVLYTDASPNLFRANDPIIAVYNADNADQTLAFTRISEAAPAAATVASIPPVTINVAEPGEDVEFKPSIVVTRIVMRPAIPDEFIDPKKVTFHHGFVEAGQPTNICRTSITATDLCGGFGVPIAGTVALPSNTPATAAQLALTNSENSQVLEQPVLVTDAAQNGAMLDARITVANDGTARIEALDATQIEIEQFELPLAIYGNLLQVTRGASVWNEVLGSGDRRKKNQRFKLRKKPLTYLPGASVGSSSLAVSTLTVRVDGIAWVEVPTFFGRGPRDRVFTVHNDDDENTFITFGDGVHGSRAPSGIDNVSADYRFGAGADAPPADHIRQLAGAVKGLRGVKSPIAAFKGRNPDGPEDLRNSAPKTALLLGRAVSSVDFAALARNAPGVVSATANWLWIDDQFQAGVVVHYIGSASNSTITNLLLNQADPTIPISVKQASPIAVRVSISIAVDPRYIAEDVAIAVQHSLSSGLLHVSNATIGGSFWTTHIFEAVAQIEGVVALTALNFSGTDVELIPNSTGGTCVPDGRYYDFSDSNAISVAAVVATAMPPLSGQKRSL